MKLSKWYGLNDVMGFDPIDDFFGVRPVAFKHRNFNVDVYEKEGVVHFDAELPGFKKEDINITFNEGVLTLTAKNEKKEEEKKENYYFTERRYGEFRRSFELGENIDQESINAEYADGILHIAVKRLEPEKKEPKKIEIH